MCRGVDQISHLRHRYTRFTGTGGCWKNTFGVISYLSIFKLTCFAIIFWAMAGGMSGVVVFLTTMIVVTKVQCLT